MKKSKLDNPPVKAEVVKRLATGESQSSIAEDIGLHRSQVSRLAKREDVKPFIEAEQMKLVEAVWNVSIKMRHWLREFRVENSRFPALVLAD
jgi:transcriptional regulator with XRE-family HTH domain